MANNALQPGAVPANADACPSRRNFLIGAMAAPAALVAPAFASARSDWERAVADYKAMLAAVEAHPYGRVLGAEDDPAISAEFQRLWSLQSEAEKKLMKMPVPDHAALAEKIEIMASTYDAGYGMGDMFAAFARDARQLGGLGEAHHG